jgi:hypothetical protein
MNAGYRCCILPLHQKASLQSSPVKISARIVNITFNNQQVNTTTKNAFPQITVYVSKASYKNILSYSSGNGTVDKFSFSYQLKP